MIAEAWKGVSRELDIWADRGLRSKFWLRDDDAYEMSVQLELLHGLARRHHINIGLAVVPGKMRSSLVCMLVDAQKEFHPMCHGWNHTDYGPPGNPEEFGDARPLAALCSDATMAYENFSKCFRKNPVIFVPPWNRITPALVKSLPRIGFAGISMWPSQLEHFALRMSSRLPWVPAVKLPLRSGFPRFDVHVDVIDWRRRTARDVESVAAALIEQLRLRRKGFLPFAHPVGLLTHHLAHSERVWLLCDELLEVLKSHGAVDFLSAACLIDSGPKLVSQNPA
jgi:hypothetical protein